MHSNFSITKKTFLGMIVFGIVMGLIFPFYASFFVRFKEGMYVYFFIGCIVAGIVVGVVGFHIAKFFILNKIKEISDHMVEASRGDIDFSKRFYIDSNDVIGELFINFNKILDSLENMIDKVYNTTKDLHLSSKELSISSNNVANSSAVQARSIEDIVEIIDDLQFSNRDNMARLSDIIKFSKDNKKIILSCDAIFKATNEAMLKIKHSIEKIITFAEFTEDMALQVNLLAINTSIEATRAGSSGRAFSVLSKEIRNLSFKTDEYANNIKEYISEMEFSMKSGGEAIENMLDVFREISVFSDNLISGIDVIYDSFMKQTSNIEKIGDLIKVISTEIEENSALSEELAETSEKLVKNIRSLEILVSSMNKNIRK